MKRLVFLVLPTILVSGFVNNANADWEFTKWTMTEPAVIAAAKSKRLVAERATGPEVSGATCSLRLPAGYTIGGIAFNSTWFCFGPGGTLAQVRLTTAAEHFYDLDQSLRATFGPPLTSGQSIPYNTYGDPAKGNRLTLYKYNDTSLIYSPVRTGF